MSQSTYTQGVYQAGEGQISVRGRFAKDKKDRLIIGCHGRTPSATAGQACLQFAQGSLGAGPHWNYLVEHGYGYSILGIDAGGNLSWGNPASETAVGNAITWAKGAGWADPNAKVVLLGYSMGGGVAANYALNHPNNVAGLILEAPGLDFDYFYANGYAAELDAAYSGNYTANGKVRSPLSFASSFNFPVRMYTALDDTVVPSSVVHNFYNAMPATADKKITDLPGGGHTAFWDLIDNASLVAWLDSLTY